MDTLFDRLWVQAALLLVIAFFVGAPQFFWHAHPLVRTTWAAYFGIVSATAWFVAAAGPMWHRRLRASVVLPLALNAVAASATGGAALLAIPTLS